MHVLEDHSKIEIKSSLSRDEFPDLVKVFQKHIGLKKIANTREEAESPKSGIKDSLWVLLALPIVLTVLTNAILTDQLKNAPYSKNTLEIVAPIPSKDKAVILPTGKIHLLWVLKHEQWFRIHLNRDRAAEVLILNATGDRIEQKPQARPGVEFTLPPGSYQAIVTLDDLGLNDKLSFEVASPAKPAVSAGSPKP